MAPYRRSIVLSGPIIYIGGSVAFSVLQHKVYFLNVMVRETTYLRYPWRQYTDGHLVEFLVRYHHLQHKPLARI